ncbi:MAG: TIM barrel protein [Rhizobiaceae bacterium]|nr:TIM barrel protein [Rhizobiaceae bacterium]
MPLTDGIRAAKRAGFDAVECHFPYDIPAETVKSALQETGLQMLGINTALGPEGCFGLGAIKGREIEARCLIDEAIEYAATIGARHVNTLAGLTGGAGEAEEVYQENLAYAAKKAAEHGMMIVIEPLNPRAVADYHFSSVDTALEIVKAVNQPNLKIMFDFFHVQIVQGDLETLIRQNIDHIGHVQIAAVHDRGEPDIGEIAYPYILGALYDAGYSGYVGAEYKPRNGSVEAGLGWMAAYRN